MAASPEAASGDRTPMLIRLRRAVRHWRWGLRRPRPVLVRATHLGARTVAWVVYLRRYPWHAVAVRARGLWFELIGGAAWRDIRRGFRMRRGRSRRCCRTGRVGARNPNIRRVPHRAARRSHGMIRPVGPARRDCGARSAAGIARYRRLSKSIRRHSNSLNECCGWRSRSWTTDGRSPSSPAWPRPRWSPPCGPWSEPTWHPAAPSAQRCCTGPA